MIVEKFIAENKKIGNYQLLNLLGKGRLAEVWLARQMHLGFAVALKIIVDKRGNKLIRQFEQEVESLARLEHPNILTPIDYGNTGDYLYLAMPIASGGSLEAILSDRQLSQTEALQLFGQILDGLNFAQSHGVIHGDLKPANILFLTQDLNRPVISDFGLANTLSLNEEVFLTLTGSITGSPEYMAPEQFIGQTGQTSDQYAAAVILFELLTGQKPFQGNTAWELGMRHTNDPIPLPHPRIPASLEPFLTTALNKNPGRRFKNTWEMREAFYKAVTRLQPEKPVRVPPKTASINLKQETKQQRRPAAEVTGVSRPVLPQKVGKSHKKLSKARRKQLWQQFFLVLLMVVFILVICLLLNMQPHTLF